MIPSKPLIRYFYPTKRFVKRTEMLASAQRDLERGGRVTIDGKHGSRTFDPGYTITLKDIDQLCEFPE